MSRSDSIQSLASAGVWGALSLPVRANASQRSSDGPSRSGFGAIPSATCSAGKFSTANGGSGALPPPPPPAPPPPLWICGGTAPTRRASSSPAWSSMSVGSSEEMRHQSPGSRESAAVSEVAWTSIFVWSSRFSESNHSSSDHRDGSGARSGSFQAKWTSRNDAIHSLASAPLPLPAAWPRRNSRQMSRATLCSSRPRRARNPIRSPFGENRIRWKQGEIRTGGSEQAGDVYFFTVDSRRGRERQAPRMTHGPPEVRGRAPAE